MPIFTQKTVYLARIGFTPDYEKKAAVADLYLGKTDDAVSYQLLRQQRIKYVLLTALDGYSKDHWLKRRFIQLIYENPEVAIFLVKN